MEDKKESQAKKEQNSNWGTKADYEANVLREDVEYCDWDSEQND